MEKKIYDLLNNVEMDLSEYQEMDLSSEEKKQIKNKVLQEEDNGVKLLKATRTKGAIHLVIEEPNYSAKPYNDKFNDPDRAISDKNGNMLEWLSGYHDMQKDGSCISYITLPDDGGEDYTFEVTNKNKDGGQIAKIKFHLDR